MEEGRASDTARRVAAHRLDYPRVPAPYGDPAADLALTQDVADGAQVRQSRMHHYLRARTAFFDRIVTTHIDEGITQVVVGAAGYDGRAFRYAKDGVRWFEVDHPATQADKLDRVRRLGIDARHVRFVAADFVHAAVDDLLLEAGLDPAAPALFLLEGIAVYLDRPVLERVLRQFRGVTVPGSPLAISVSAAVTSSPARETFRATVAAMGEPARLALAPGEAQGLLAGQGWQVTEDGDRLRPAGLLTARAAEIQILYPERSRPTPRTHPSPAGAPAPVLATVPLPALLSHALVAFTIECDNEAEHRIPHRTTAHGRSPGAPRDAPWLTSLVMWANCLRLVPGDGISVRDMERLARTGTNLDGMRRWGYVTFSPGPVRGKQPAPDALVRLTVRGHEARDIWNGVPEIVESRWRDRFGDSAVGALRAALAAVVANLDPAFPDCLPILGYGLSSRAESADASAQPGAPAASAEGLPLWALLSKTLLAFATDFERESPVSLAISANVLRVLSADRTRPRDVPALTGVSKESIAMAMGILTKLGLAREDPDPSASRGKVIRLTEAGVAAQHAYHDEVAKVEPRWRATFGANRVAALRATLEPLAQGDLPPLFAGLTPYPGNWRAQVSPPRVLPHYPMVLHRGGYPDGS